MRSHWHVMRPRTSKVWQFMAPHTMATVRSQQLAEQIAARGEGDYAYECSATDCKVTTVMRR